MPKLSVEMESTPGVEQVFVLMMIDGVEQERYSFANQELAREAIHRAYLGAIELQDAGQIKGLQLVERAI